MYPTSRTSFAAVLGIVGMFLLTLSTAFGWNPEIINGVQYIPMSEVRTHYKLTRERTEGRQKVYEVPEKIQIRIQARSQEMFMNNMKFVLSYPVADHPSKGLMVSNMDLHKIIDPVLRPTYIANRRSFNTVVIDPGHGGHDSGTRNRISREADINLSVGKKLRDRLKAMGYQVVMTRDTDNFIALQDRVRIANRHNNAIFISIHFNDGGSSARGVETFTLAPAGTSSSMSRNIRHDALQGNAQDSMNIALATAVQGHMLKGPLAIKEGISMVDRGIKRARYSVLCTIKHPAILVEGGFMSNPQEAMGYQVVMTRDTDNFIALQDRVRIANRHNNAIFISIHFNDGGSSARGVETFTLAPAGTSSSMSRNIRHDALQGNAQDSMNIALATAVQGHMLKGPLAIKEGISMVDRGIKRARYSVLCTIKHPAILVEGGFMSNPQEALLIATERYQNFMASSLAAAVHQYRTALGRQVRRTR